MIIAIDWVAVKDSSNLSDPSGCMETWMKDSGDCKDHGHWVECCCIPVIHWQSQCNDRLEIPTSIAGVIHSVPIDCTDCMETRLYCGISYSKAIISSKWVDHFVSVKIGWNHVVGHLHMVRKHCCHENDDALISETIWWCIQTY